MQKRAMTYLPCVTHIAGLWVIRSGILLTSQSGSFNNKFNYG